MINRATEILNIKNPKKIFQSNNNQQSSSNINDLKNRISSSRSLVENSRANNISSDSLIVQHLALEPLGVNTSEEGYHANSQAELANKQIQELNQKINKLEKSTQTKEILYQIADLENTLSNTNVQADFWSERATQWQEETNFNQNGPGYAEKDKKLVEKTYEQLIELQKTFGKSLSSDRSGYTRAIRAEIVLDVKTNQAILDVLKQGKSSESIDKNAIEEAGYSNFKAQAYKEQTISLEKNLKQWGTESQSKDKKIASQAKQQMASGKELLEKSQAGNKLFSILEKFYDAESTRSYTAEQKKNLNPIHKEIINLTNQFDVELGEDSNSKYKASYNKIINLVNKVNNFSNSTHSSPITNGSNPQTNSNTLTTIDPKQETEYSSLKSNLYNQQIKELNDLKKSWLTIYSTDPSSRKEAKKNIQDLNKQIKLSTIAKNFWSEEKDFWINLDKANTKASSVNNTETRTKEELQKESKIQMLTAELTNLENLMDHNIDIGGASKERNSISSEIKTIKEEIKKLHDFF